MRRPEGSRAALLISLALHVVLILAWRIGTSLPEADPTAPNLIVLLPGEAADHEQHDLPAALDARTTPEAEAEPGTGAPPAPLDAGAALDAGGAPAPPPGIPAAGAAASGDTGSRPARAAAGIRPQYGDGSVWVEPYPETPAALADRVRRSHGQLVDSAVTAIVQGYLDSLALEPGADRAQLPEWVTDVGGKKYGLDAKYIYVAGLKIPSAVLALLPFPQGNVDQALANRRLQDLRADLFQAANRAENAAEFKKAIADIRQRKVEEEEFERNRRTRPGEGSTP